MTNLIIHFLHVALEGESGWEWGVGATEQEQDRKEQQQQRRRVYDR